MNTCSVPVWAANFLHSPGQGSSGVGLFGPDAKATNVLPESKMEQSQKLKSQLETETFDCKVNSLCCSQLALTFGTD